MKNMLYRHLSAGFSEWLRILNFERGSQKDMPKMLNAFLVFLEMQHCHQIRDITETHIVHYLHYVRGGRAKPERGR